MGCRWCHVWWTLTEIFFCRYFKSEVILIHTDIRNVTLCHTRQTVTLIITIFPIIRIIYTRLTTTLTTSGLDACVHARCSWSQVSVFQHYCNLPLASSHSRLQLFARPPPRIAKGDKQVIRHADREPPWTASLPVAEKQSYLINCTLSVTGSTMIFVLLIHV